MHKKIGLAGKSTSGKDAIADYIEQFYGYRKIAIGDPIRKELQTFLTEIFKETLNANHSFDVVIKAFESAVWDKPTTAEIRILLQWFGGLKRESDPNYWINKFKEELYTENFLIISDVRLPIEFDAIHEASGEIWLIDRPGLGNVGIPGHDTEIGLQDAKFDRIIMNDGTLQQLWAKIDFIFLNC